MVHAAPLVTVDVVDETDAVDGDGSCPVEDDRPPADDPLLAADWMRELLPALASASVILLV